VLGPGHEPLGEAAKVTLLALLQDLEPESCPPEAPPPVTPAACQGHSRFAAADLLFFAERLALLFQLVGRLRTKLPAPLMAGMSGRKLAGLRLRVV
jgi:hypothetical protein